MGVQEIKLYQIILSLNRLECLINESKIRKIKLVSNVSEYSTAYFVSQLRIKLM